MDEVISWAVLCKHLELTLDTASMSFLFLVLRGALQAIVRLGAGIGMMMSVCMGSSLAPAPPPPSLSLLGPGPFAAAAPEVVDPPEFLDSAFRNASRLPWEAAATASSPNPNCLINGVTGPFPSRLRREETPVLLLEALPSAPSTLMFCKMLLKSANPIRSLVAAAPSLAWCVGAPGVVTTTGGAFAGVEAGRDWLLGVEETLDSPG
ncbi:unnamed protein product [Cyprideis torosa]|uniref:Uncharacterized protein n=1 Tax=Cyprideis torosa TaxID=163714 RepID=A0A7R8WDI3_9CRUS|nr:unnamed protein product [Cyprideis torosa]CAG0889056.1 unnamed protein product [Cyprideis torosa]